jgi:ketosteroid isomerase-like protein
MNNAPRPRKESRRKFCLLLPLCICAVAACSRSASITAPAPDLAAEKRALLQRDSEWQAAVAEKKDVAKIVSFFAADGIMFGSGEPTDDSREALTRAVAGLVADPSFKDQWSWSRVELSPDGRLAYLVGTTDITFNDANGHPVTNHARLLNVWRKDPDGVWRCLVDVWVDPPPSGH